MLACEFCPESRRKTYLSYPALYYHVREKHPGKTVSSAKGRQRSRQPSEPAPVVLKLKTILKGEDPEREEIERELINLKQFLCMKLSEQFLAKKMVEFSQLGVRGADKHMSEVRERALRLADEMRFRRESFAEAEGGEIFRVYFTRICPVSFGRDLVRYFGKRVELAAKLHLQAVLLEAIDQCLIDRAQLRDYEQMLWGERAGVVMGGVKEQWLKWKAVNKELLTEDYEEDHRHQ
jgi:hypothetical protein